MVMVVPAVAKAAAVQVMQKVVVMTTTKMMMTNLLRWLEVLLTIIQDVGNHHVNLPELVEENLSLPIKNSMINVAILNEFTLPGTELPSDKPVPNDVVICGNQKRFLKVTKQDIWIAKPEIEYLVDNFDADPGETFKLPKDQFEVKHNFNKPKIFYHINCHKKEHWVIPPGKSSLVMSYFFKPTINYRFSLYV